MDTVDRREFLKLSSAGGLGLLLLAACSDTSTITSTTAAPGSTTTLAATATTGPGASTTSTAQSATRALIFRLPAAPNRLDPAQVQTVYDGQINWCTFESPATHNLSGDGVVPVLAETWEIADDGLSISFTLKQGVEFHGGYGELTAEDVKFAYERIAGLTEPPLESRHQVRWAPLESVEITGTHSGIIHLSQTSPGFLNDQLHYVTGHIYPQQSVADLGEDIVLHPLGTGPYMLEEVTPEQVTLVPFADWFGASSDLYGNPVVLPQLVGRVITDDNAAELALQSGELDFAQVPPEAAERLQADSNLSVAVIPTTWIHWLSLNPQIAKLADINVRQAIRFGIDVDSVAEVAYPGSRRATSLLSPDTGWGTGFSSSTTYDPERAMEFLAAAGVEDFQVVLRLISTWVGMPRAGEIIQANLRDIGINCEVRSLELSQWLAESESEDAQAVDEISLHIFSNIYDPSNLLNRFRAEATYVPSHLENSEYEEVMNTVDSELDRTVRDGAIVRALEILEEEATTLWLAHPANAYAMSSELAALLPEKFAQPFYPGFAWS